MLTGAGLYVHVPFCSSVCPYCDFAVLIGGRPRRRIYVEALLREADLRAAAGLCFDTVYLGGGTPSALDDDLLPELVEGLRRRLCLDDGARFFLEINPEDVTPDRAATWRRLGFEFASVGVQSFDDRILAALGRTHSAATAVAAVRTLKESGFDTVAADLIFAVPGQDEACWRRQLDTAVALEVDHLSTYQLTVHAGTVLGRRHQRGEFVEVGEHTQAELYLLTHAVLGDAGYQAYEVSNFAAGSHHRSAHNRKYWTHVPYVGLGPSAHSFVDGRRWWNRRKLRLWQRALLAGQEPVAGEERLSQRQLLLEAVMLGLRTAEGLDLASLDERFGVDLAAANRELLDRLESNGEVRMQGSRVLPTAVGMLRADGIAREFSC